MVSKIIDNIADATFLTSNRMGFMGNLSNIANKTLMLINCIDCIKLVSIKLPFNQSRQNSKYYLVSET